MKTLRIKKNNEGIVCWKVDTQDITYNTEFDIDKGITLLITYQGKNYVPMKNAHTLGSVINPGKNKKVFNQEIECDIIALDETAEYSALWGVGIANVMDKFTGIMQNIQANGSYYFRIRSIEDFVKTMNIDAKQALNQEDIKLMFRNKVHEIIKSNIAQLLNSRSVVDVQGKLSDVSDITKQMLDSRMKEYGITITSFVIAHLGFSQDEEEVIQKIKEAQLDTALAKISNQVVRDDLTIKADYENSVGKLTEQNNADNIRVICKKCNSQNKADAVYCNKCGEKLQG